VRGRGISRPPFQRRQFDRHDRGKPLGPHPNPLPACGERARAQRFVSQNEKCRKLPCHCRRWPIAVCDELSVGAASFDRGVGFSHFTGQITHHIAPDIDAERDFVITGLTAAGMLDATYQVSGIGPTLTGVNGGGDRYFTDGEVTIGVLSVNAARVAETPRELANPPAVEVKQSAWRPVARLFRWLGDGR